MFCIILNTVLFLLSCGGGGGGAASASLSDSEYTTHNPGGWGGGGSSGGSSGGSNNEGSGPEVTVQGGTPLNVTGYIFNSITYTSVEELTRAMLAANAGGSFEITFMVAGETSPRTAKVSRTDRGYNIDLQYKATCVKNSVSTIIMYYTNSGINLSSLNEAGIAYWQVSGGSTYTGSLITGVKGDITITAMFAEDIPVPEGMVYVEGGTSGSDTIPNLLVCDHEVTQYEYETYCGYRGTGPRDSYGLGTNYPVNFVSMYDTFVYCNLRSMAEGLQPCYTINSTTDPSAWPDITTGSNGKPCGPSSSNSAWNNVSVDNSKNGYRLPTYKQWQWAAKGGTNRDSYQYAGSNTIGDVAWYKYNSGDNGTSTNRKPHPVKGKQPNSLGLYDMSGNMPEWVYESIINATTLSLYGGSWSDDASDCKVTSSSSCTYGASYYYTNTGFRVVRKAN